MSQVSRLALRYWLANVTITNVPGPDVPLLSDAIGAVAAEMVDELT
jgi:hypothetical protein